MRARRPASRAPLPPPGGTPGSPRRLFEQPLIDALGDEEWAREQAAGATLTLEEAITLARTLAKPTPESTHTA